MEFEAQHSVQLSPTGGGKNISSALPEPVRIVPHPRTMRKAREQIKWMVHDGFSIQSIRRYLHRFVLWWVNTSDLWTYDELLILFKRLAGIKVLRYSPKTFCRNIR